MLNSMKTDLNVNLSIQDGTINYLNLPPVTDGLRFLSAYGGG